MSSLVLAAILSLGYAFWADSKGHECYAVLGIACFLVNGFNIIRVLP